MAYHSHASVLELLDKSALEPCTSIDYLEVTHSSVDQHCYEWRPDIQEEILDYLDPSHKPTFRIFFLKSMREEKEFTNGRIRAKRSTFEKICASLNIEISFLNIVLAQDPWRRNAVGGATFHRYGEGGELLAIDGFYLSLRWRIEVRQVWFSYEIKSKSITYLVVDCLEEVKQKLVENAKDHLGCFLHKPFALDLLLAEHNMNSLKSSFVDYSTQLFQWENIGSEGMPLSLRHIANTPRGLEKIYSLARYWSIIQAYIDDFETSLIFLHEAACKIQAAGSPSSDTSAPERVAYLKTEQKHLRAWVISYSERTRLIINFFFSIASQNENRTNLRIASLTTTIAEETQRDSSSMITIATMTMLFLPGTFISAIFSMVFFNSSVDGAGNETFAVSTRIWLFPTVTIPLTLLVFAFYEWWRRKRERKMTTRRSQKDVQEGNKTEA